MKSIRIPKTEKLRDYQITGVKHLMSGKHKLLLDDMGLGKTAQTIIAMASLGAKRALIICPPAVKYQWADEIQRWSVKKYKVHVSEGIFDRIPEDVDIVIVAYSTVFQGPIHDQLYARKWPVMILDEAHYCKNTKAKRTQAVYGRRGLVKRAVYTYLLSGTLMTNTPIDLWPIFKTIGAKHLPKSAQGWMNYTRVYCSRFRGVHGWDVSGARNLPDLKARLFGSGLALRRTKEEVLTELPDKVFRILPMQQTEEGRKIEVEYATLLSDLDFDKSKLGMDAAEFAQVRKELGLAKVSGILSMLEEYWDRKVVVFCWHRDVVESIYRDSGRNAVKYYGGMSSADKRDSVKTFCEGGADLFVGNITSAGTGLDGLQYGCSDIIFAETPWTFTELAQASDRLHRYGQKSSVNIDIPVLRGSTEEYIVKSVLKKEKIFSAVFGLTTLGKSLTSSTPKGD